MGGYVPFDGRPNHRASLSDLSRPLMEDFLLAVGGGFAGRLGEASTEERALDMRIALRSAA